MASIGTVSLALPDHLLCAFDATSAIFGSVSLQYLPNWSIDKQVQLVADLLDHLDACNAQGPKWSRASKSVSKAFTLWDVSIAMLHRRDPAWPSKLDVLGDGMSVVLGDQIPEVGP